MKKIMFNDRFGLTSAVLEGRKTMTRRLMKVPILRLNDVNYALKDSANLNANKAAIIKKYAAYVVGEEVAVAQSYKDIFEEAMNGDYWSDIYERFRQADVDDKKGWDNKMFVNAELMPHRIKITDIMLECIQDISDEDIMREGIMEGEFMNTWDRYYFDVWGDVANHITFNRPRDAYRELIDRISGKGTWQSNPWVYVYTFELIR